MMTTDTHLQRADLDTDDEEWLGENYDLYEDGTRQTTAATTSPEGAVTNGRGQQAILAQQREEVTKTPLVDKDVDDGFQEQEEDEEWFLNITDTFIDLSSSCVIDREKFHDPAHISPVKVRGQQLSLAVREGGDYSMFREMKDDSSGEEEDVLTGQEDCVLDAGAEEGDSTDDTRLAELLSDTSMVVGIKSKPVVTNGRGTLTGMAGGEELGGTESRAGTQGVRLHPPTNITTTHPPPSPAVTQKDDTGLGECAYIDGVCRIHGKAEKLWKPSKIWAKKKNGVFGWKYTKLTYFSCRKIARTPMETVQPTFVSMGGSTALHSTTNFTVLCNGGIRGRRGLESKKSTDRK